MIIDLNSIICNELEKEWKTFIADSVYYFYKYRNSIVHDGKSYLDFDEVQLNNIVNNMKHVIFEIVHYYFKKQPDSIKDIKQMVIDNQTQDKLENAFDYISSDAGEVYKFLMPED